VGKRTITYAKESKIGTIIAAFDEITTKNISKIAHTISDIVINPQNSYTKVLIFSNILKTFFLQRPQVFTLIPLEPFDIQETQFPEIILEDYMWEQKVDEILDILVKQYIDANLQYLLFESLLAEHAARFISMDNSTRNAQNLLETTKLDYNKLRQAKITKELAELIGSFE
jgi:F-type H+-transporting ATPase subunit gamma